MIIIESREYDVILKRDFDYKNRPVFTVVYGLEINRYTDFETAFIGFKNAVFHAVQNEGFKNA